MPSKNMHKIAESTYALINPKPFQSIPDWCRDNLILPSDTSSESGPLCIQLRTPYMVAPLANMLDSTTRTVVLMTGIQLGKTSSLLATMLYQANVDPAPQLFVLPTKVFAGDFVRKRLKPQINSSPKIKKMFYKKTEKSTMNVLMYRGGSLTLVGTEVATDLASAAIKFLYLDEIDRFKKDTGGEGSPIDIAMGRLTTYSHSSKAFLTSTPVLDTDPINSYYSQGDQQKYHVPCPNCYKTQELVFEQLHWVKPEDAHYICIHCKNPIEQKHHNWMMQRGEWGATSPPIDATIKSYHISTLYSPFYSWRNLVLDYLKSRGDAIAERTFDNTRLGIPYNTVELKHSYQNLYENREDFTLGSPIDNRVVVIVAAFDVQKAYVKGAVYGIGAGFEMWLIDVVEIPGAIEEKQLQEKLEAATNARYKTQDGREIPIACTAIDVGYATVTITTWIKERGFGDRHIKPIKGMARNPNKLVRYPNAKSKDNIYGIDTASFKENFYARLDMEKKEGSNPGYIHFGQMREGEFKELCAERKEMVINKKTNQVDYKWVNVAEDKRNEMLDVSVYCLALIHILYNKWTPVDFEQQKNIDARAARLPDNQDDIEADKRLKDFIAKQDEARVEFDNRN